MAMFKGLTRRVAGAAAQRQVATALAMLLAAGPALADPVIVNGGFDTAPSQGSTEFGTRFAGQVVPGWTTTGYNFVFLPGTADTTGAANQYGGALKLWGPGTKDASGASVQNGLTATSPDGGNFVGADGAFGQAPIQQTITGLSVNSIAKISFYYAGAQQYGYDSPTTEAWSVTLGNQTLTTDVLSNPTHGFTGWKQATLSFVVTNTTEVLSFLALGTPAGVPPFSLLDGVSISQVPEPTSLALLGLFLGGTGLAARRRHRRLAA